MIKSFVLHSAELKSQKLSNSEWSKKDYKPNNGVYLFFIIIVKCFFRAVEIIAFFLFPTNLIIYYIFLGFIIIKKRNFLIDLYVVY